MSYFSIPGWEGKHGAVFRIHSGEKTLPLTSCIVFERLTSMYLFLSITKK
jgi:hypothetical protein